MFWHKLPYPGSASLNAIGASGPHQESESVVHVQAQHMGGSGEREDLTGGNPGCRRSFNHQGAGQAFPLLQYHWTSNVDPPKPNIVRPHAQPAAMIRRAWSTRTWRSTTRRLPSSTRPCPNAFRGPLGMWPQTACMRACALGAWQCMACACVMFLGSAGVPAPGIPQEFDLGGPKSKAG